MAYSQVKNIGAFFSAVVALVLAAFFCFFRIGFDNSGDTSLFSVFTVLATSWFIILLPSGIRHIQQRFNIKEKESWLVCDAMILLLALFFVISAGILVAFTGMNISLLFVVIGVTLFAWCAFDCLRQVKPLVLIPAGLLIILYSLWLMGLVWGSGYLNPLFYEGVFYGFGHVDTLYHSSIAGMLKTYGIVSTGLNGVPFTGYHFGSHLIFAHLSSLLKIKTITFYQLGFPVIIIPLFINVMLSFVFEIRRLVLPDMKFNIGTDIKFWILLIIMQIGVLNFGFYNLFDYAIRYDRYISESYAFSIIISLLLLSLFARFWSTNKEEGFTPGNSLFLLVIVPIIVGFIVLAKASIGYLIMVLGWYFFLRMRLYRRPIFAISFILMCILSIASYIVAFHPYLVLNLGSHSVHSGAGDTPLTIINSSLMRNIVRIIPHILLPVYFLLYYFLAITFIGLRIYKTKVRTLGMFYEAVRRNEFVDIETVVILALFGFLPGVFLFINSGGEGYFADYQGIIAMLFLLAYLPRFLPDKNSIKFFKGNICISRKMIDVFLFLIFSFFVVAMVFYAKAKFHHTLEQNIDYRIAIINKRDQPISFSDIEKQFRREKNIGKTLALIRPLYNKDSISNGLKKNARYKLMKSVSVLGELPHYEKNKTLLFASNVESCWYSSKKRGHVPFIMPALTEIALIDGLPPFGDKAHEIYFLKGYYPFYQPRERPQSSADKNPAVLCVKVKQMGFSQLIVVDSNNGEIRKFKCRNINVLKRSK
ncbi:MAG: hypothetical protein FD145_103 [Candidatus Saganbacteria bacterium]|uniref:Uncharacterized protein n=1 Tax=Candidatus Saganbacteria bacterium TaxID=2575572 RepID=A0A833L2J3_UNCSA|nr:MAG: hypothetical protein FD145_103 [Candidatus Saganbacteria bacterium]